jgi:hypothetical protein
LVLTEFPSVFNSGRRERPDRGSKSELRTVSPSETWSGCVIPWDIFPENRWAFLTSLTD